MFLSMKCFREGVLCFNGWIYVCIEKCTIKNLFSTNNKTRCNIYSSPPLTNAGFPYVHCKNAIRLILTWITVNSHCMRMSSLEILNINNFPSDTDTKASPYTKYKLNSVLADEFTLSIMWLQKIKMIKMRNFKLLPVEF